MMSDLPLQPSEAFEKVYREYSEAVENLQALEGAVEGRRFRYEDLAGKPFPGMTPEEAARKAQYEATIAKHEPEVLARFPA